MKQRRITSARLLLGRAPKVQPKCKSRRVIGSLDLRPSNEHRYSSAAIGALLRLQPASRLARPRRRLPPLPSARAPDRLAARDLIDERFLFGSCSRARSLVGASIEWRFQLGRPHVSPPAARSKNNKRRAQNKGAASEAAREQAGGRALARRRPIDPSRRAGARLSRANHSLACALSLVGFRCLLIRAEPS